MRCTAAGCASWSVAGERGCRLECAIASPLYTPDLPDPDLIIRTAGESRVSNFLLWQSAYSEMLVTDTLWPDFGVDELKSAIAEYNSRVRRFGGRPDQELAASR